MGPITRSEIQQQRLHQQRLTGDPLATPAEVVSWLGAVQAQDYAGAKWALGLRLGESTDALVDKAFDDGAILRTHIMRPTWHFVTPGDIRWIQALTAPRVNAVNASMYRRLELDHSLFSRTNEIITEALEGGKQFTREELGAALAERGIESSGMRLGYIIHRAELDAIVCSGPRRGKQFTYMLVAERAPQARILPRDEALAELALRYFTGHGPATVRDFAWWSGLSMADAKLGVESAGSSLFSEDVDGSTYWFSASVPPVEQRAESGFLLPTYDEYFIGFTGDSRAIGVEMRGLIFDSTVVLDGGIAGTWRRTFQKGSVVVEVKMLPAYAGQEERVVAAADQFGAFLEMPVVLREVNASNLATTGWMQSRLRNRDRASQSS